MSILPEFLLDSYESLCNSDIVKNKTISQETIGEFVTYLNCAIPKKYTTEYTIYLFNRTKYKMNRWKFMKDIQDSPYKSMVLWTNYKEILKHFNLIQRFYLKWDKEKNEYVGDIYDPSKHSITPSSVIEEPKNTVPITDETKEEPILKEINENEAELNEKKVEEYMDDQDRLMEYMQKRKKELEMKLNQEKNNAQ
jgi:hypothetical protein